MFKDVLRKLGPEFGFLSEQENAQAESDIMNKLDRSVKLDEVDTVTFGLETDDGKIVKVYVKADQAEDFEKALADKLGEIDDIEEVLNELSKEYDIVDVEWPSEETKDEDADEDDGSDVLDKKVYDNSKENAETEKKLKPNLESLSFGELTTLQLLESTNSNTIESRFITAPQLLVYHAILELGVPELALARSPYRAAIIKGIKNKAIELSNNPAIKTALKMFINRSIDYEERAEKNKKAAGGKELNDSINIERNESFLTEGAVQVFWETFTKLVNYLAVDQNLAKKFLESPQLTQLRSRSSSTIASKVPVETQTKMKELVAAIDAEPKTESVNESASPDEVYGFIKDMLTLADEDGKTADAVMKTSAWNTFFNSFKPKLSQKFNGATQSKLSALEKLMPSNTVATEEKTLKNATLIHPYSYGSEKFDAGHPVEVIGEDGDYYIVKAFPIMANSQMKFKKSDVKLTGKINVPIGGPGGAMPGGLNESQVPVWTFDTEEDSTIIQCQSIKIKLNSEEIEKLVKGISNHDTVIVRDEEDPTHKVAFSPRGTSVMVKKVGTVDGVLMKQKYVDDMMSFISRGEEEEKPADDQDQETDDADAEPKELEKK